MKRLYMLLFFALFTLFVLYPAAEASAEKTVVIDPGHGGRFSGTTGYSGGSTGYYEKHFNLEVGKKLYDALEAKGYNVHITRTSDSHFAYGLHDDLQARVDFADQSAKDDHDNAIFLSLHSNALPSNPYMRGYETYYFDMNNISSTYPPSPEQIEYAPESKRLAQTMHRYILDGTPLGEGRGMVPSNLYVTRNAVMPAALLEFGYMSNPTEEKLIKTESFQEKAVQSVTEAVDSYFSVYEVFNYEGEKVKLTSKKEEAISHAENMEYAYVFDKYQQKVIYENTSKRYGVYHEKDQSSDRLFVTRDKALEFAKKSSNVRVVDNEQGEVIWSDYLAKAYEVVHSSHGVLKGFHSLEKALDYAGDWKNTAVIEKEKDEVIWSNYLSEEFEVVHTDKGVLNTFYREEKAIAYAEEWKNTKVRNRTTEEVVWDNSSSDYQYMFNSSELAGKDRIKTAVEVSKSLYPNGFNKDGERTVVLATAYEFADALSAGPLAADLGNAPILLNRDDRLDPAVVEELKRLNANKVVILGGTNAISEKVQNELSSLYTVERISGKNRIQSNLEINNRLSDVEGVFVASSTSFPDALEASSIAAANGWAIVLTDEKEITEESLQFLHGKEVAILGGTAVISEEVEETLIERNGGDRVVRLSGINRYETVAATLDYFKDDMRSGTMLVATGRNYPDALTASAISARTKAPLILVGNDLNPELQKTLSWYGTENVVQNLRVIGGVVGNTQRDEIAGYLK
ncbi:cell wall-binding repeat-containing protein [Halobacillus sp. GSS1]|uniref:cell wall-binding repeat-containing protein n=1 Tax=Halobacillus sp. GSS1 TaxID=2815919 RepID=UPI001A9053BD|nr:cell wall-binding repeat-containing protein [Halobacillus sp. GSS1]MBN9655081.1 cell wall-binding repeat-containing protein [Halobacillus sp. GSS1]